MKENQKMMEKIEEKTKGLTKKIKEGLGILDGNVSLENKKLMKAYKMHGKLS